MAPLHIEWPVVCFLWGYMEDLVWWIMGALRNWLCPSASSWPVKCYRPQTDLARDERHSWADNLTEWPNGYSRTASWKNHWFTGGWKARDEGGGILVEEEGEEGADQRSISGKQQICFWFGHSVSNCASQARNRSHASYWLPAPVQPTFSCDPKQSPHTSYPELSAAQISAGPHIEQHSCFLGICPLSMCWPPGHFLYEVTSSRETSMTNHALTNPAQEVCVCKVAVSAKPHQGIYLVSECPQKWKFNCGTILSKDMETQTRKRKCNNSLNSIKY